MNKIIKNENNQLNKLNFIAKFQFISIIIVYFLVMPRFFYYFIEIRFIVIIVASLIFLLFCFMRYKLLLRVFNHSQNVFRRLFIDNCSLLLGLVILIIIEGFVYVHSIEHSIPSMRMLLELIAFSFFYPTWSTIKKHMK
jgi:hypothetical protein